MESARGSQPHQCGKEEGRGACMEGAKGGRTSAARRRGGVCVWKVPRVAKPVQQGKKGKQAELSFNQCVDGRCQRQPGSVQRKGGGKWVKWEAGPTGDTVIGISWRREKRGKAGGGANW
jgi:hypothetical protein